MYDKVRAIIRASLMSGAGDGAGDGDGHRLIALDMDILIE